jgi:hypothetical protein
MICFFAPRKGKRFHPQCITKWFFLLAVRPDCRSDLVSTPLF